MWGFGGRYYWGNKERNGKGEGIVVVFAWMSSQERHLKNYIELYSSLGWNSLVCHSQFLNMFFPNKATTVAIDIFNELVQELKVRPRPVVFASFSGGPKACMYKVLQIIEGKCEHQLDMGDCQLVKDCIAGFIYDSSPVDFTSDLGTKFVLHPTVLGISEPPRLATWIANSIASGLDALFLSRFESHRAEYWQTLYSSVSMRSPYLILCSESDDLAPYEVICNFAAQLQDLGGDVKLVNWNESPHVGHFRKYPDDYKANVIELLGKACVIYSQRIRLLEGERMGSEGLHNDISEPLQNLRKASSTSYESFQGIALEPSDQFFLPSSMEYYEGRDIASVQDTHKEALICLPSEQSISAHGVLGQIMFDVCVPIEVENWDIRPSSLLRRPPPAPSRRHTPFNPIKCIRRSRL